MTIDYSKRYEFEGREWWAMDPQPERYEAGMVAVFLNDVERVTDADDGTTCAIDEPVLTPVPEHDPEVREMWGLNAQGWRVWTAPETRTLSDVMPGVVRWLPVEGRAGDLVKRYGADAFDGAKAVIRCGVPHLTGREYRVVARYGRIYRDHGKSESLIREDAHMHLTAPPEVKAAPMPWDAMEPVADHLSGQDKTRCSFTAESGSRCLHDEGHRGNHWTGAAEFPQEWREVAQEVPEGACKECGVFACEHTARGVSEFRGNVVGQEILPSPRGGAMRNEHSLKSIANEPPATGRDRYHPKPKPRHNPNDADDVAPDVWSDGSERRMWK